jgi:quinol monooxygenase YgiN
MVRVGLVVQLTAKEDAADEVADFLTGAVELANAEVGTPVWFALRTDERTFWIVDAFPSDDERQAHCTARSPRRCWRILFLAATCTPAGCRPRTRSPAPTTARRGRARRPELGAGGTTRSSCFRMCGTPGPSHDRRPTAPQWMLIEAPSFVVTPFG